MTNNLITRAQLLSAEEFARIVKKPSVTVRLMCRQGRIPGAIRVGGRWVIDLSRSSEIKWNVKRGRPVKETQNEQ